MRARHAGVSPACAALVGHATRPNGPCSAWRDPSSAMRSDEAETPAPSAPIRPAAEPGRLLAATDALSVTAAAQLLLQNASTPPPKSGWPKPRSRHEWSKPTANSRRLERTESGPAVDSGRAYRYPLDAAIHARRTTIVCTPTNPVAALERLAHGAGESSRNARHGLDVARGVAAPTGRHHAPRAASTTCLWLDRASAPALHPAGCLGQSSHGIGRERHDVSAA